MRKFTYACFWVLLCSAGLTQVYGIAQTLLPDAPALPPASASRSAVPSAPKSEGASATTAPSSQDPEADEKLAPIEAAKRDAKLQPGIDELSHGDFNAAYEALKTVAMVYPTDTIVLRYAAAAAMRTSHDEEALAWFQEALAQRPHDPWPMRLAVIRLEARLTRWDEFNRDLEELRTAKKNGMDHGLDMGDGFVIDEFFTVPGRVRGVIYPRQSGQFHMLYRFVLPAETAGAASGSSARDAAPCAGSDFEPHMDLESDDADQAQFARANPGKAKSERSYILDAVYSPCSRKLVKFYPNGEPGYEAVRADVLRALKAPAQQ